MTTERLPGPSECWKVTRRARYASDTRGLSGKLPLNDTTFTLPDLCHDALSCGTNSIVRDDHDVTFVMSQATMKCPSWRNGCDLVTEISATATTDCGLYNQGDKVCYRWIDINTIISITPSFSKLDIKKKTKNSDVHESQHTRTGRHSLSHTHTHTHTLAMSTHR